VAQDGTKDELLIHACFADSGAVNAMRGIWKYKQRLYIPNEESTVEATRTSVSVRLNGIETPYPTIHSFNIEAFSSQLSSHTIYTYFPFLLA